MSSATVTSSALQQSPVAPKRNQPVLKRNHIRACELNELAKQLSAFS
jgi:hypothetical protein